MSNWRSSSGGTNARGQTSVIGVVLVVAITIIGIVGILYFGAAALEEAHVESETDRAELAMTQFDSRSSLVALGSSSHQGVSVHLPSGASLAVDGDRGFMNVSVVDRADGSLEFVVVNATLGAVVYENQGTTVAYQGGGVWKGTATGGSTMVSPPEFRYRARAGHDPTLTLPLVVVQGEGSLSEDVGIAAVDTTARYPLPASGRTNPLERGEVRVTVQSDYYQAWGTFFEERTDGAVTFDHARRRVSVTLGVRPGAPGIPGGIVSGAAGGALTFEDQAEADSYDSGDGNYSATRGERTSIVAAGPVRLHNHATIYGDLVAAGFVELENKAEITGNVSHGGTLTNDGTIGGWTRRRAAADVPNPVGWLIDDKLAAFGSSNDNDDVSAIGSGSDTLADCTSTCTLPSGDYVLENVSLGNDEELVLDTSGGDVEVAVRDDVSLTSDGTVRVVGDNSARFYVEDDLSIVNEGNVSVPDERSTGLWLYMNPGTEATIVDKGRFVGVIYGPASGAQSGVDISFGDQAELYGGAVGEVDSIPNGIGIHFDEVLTQVDPLAGTGGDEPPVTYMHVTVNRVNVSSR